MHKGQKVDVNFYGMRICVAGAKSADDAYEKLCNALVVAGIIEYDTDGFQLYIAGTEEEIDDRPSRDAWPRTFDESVTVSLIVSDEERSDTQIELGRLEIEKTLRDLRRGTFAGKPEIEIKYVGGGEWHITLHGTSIIGAEHLIDDVAETLAWPVTRVAVIE